MYANLYAKIENKQIVKVAGRPNWRDAETGEPVTDELLAEHGWLPVVDEPPEHNERIEHLVKLAWADWPIETKRVVVAYDIDLIPLDQAIERLKAAVTARRWEVETGGMELPNGVHVATSTEDQNRITSVIANAQLAGVDEVDFKAASGWVRLSVADIQGIAGAIGAHVQACFSAERAHHEAIDALTDRQAVADYDIDSGWPE